MSSRPDLSLLSHEQKDALIHTLMAQVAALRARVAELEAKLGLPPKTPDNSSVPPSKGQKASEPSKPRPKANPHAGAHRPLHLNPTRERIVSAHVCQDCGADVSNVAQSAVQVYDRIEIPKVEPDVTRVTLRGGVCPCCARRFKAPAPEGLEPGSPFGPNLRAFVIYLRSVQGIPMARLSDVLKDLFDLDISEGALVNIPRKPFARYVRAFLGRVPLLAALVDRETAEALGEMPVQRCLRIARQASPAIDIIEACGDPDLFARWFRDPATWRNWFCFLKVLFGSQRRGLRESRCRDRSSHQASDGLGP